MSTVDLNNACIDEDDNLDHATFFKYLEEDNKRKLKSTATLINEMGNDFLFEIDEKKKQQDILKKKYIKYISKHSKEYKFNNKQLLLKSYDIRDVKKIYDDLKLQNQSVFTKIFKFLFNLD